MKKYVLTGGPHSGKTRVLEGLIQIGYHGIGEVSTQLINAEYEKETKNSCYKGIFPWTNLSLFQKRVFEMQLENEKSINNGVVFLDRGIGDSLVYLLLHEKKVPKHWEYFASNAGYEKVFHFELIPNAKQSKIRKDLDRAEEISKLTREVYEKFGFDVVEVPLFEVGEKGIKKRVKFVLERL